MNRQTSLEERVEIMNLAQAGWSDKQIAQHTGWRLSTVRKWRRRARDGGRAGLLTRLGRPRRGP